MTLHSRLAAIETHLRNHRYRCWTDLREIELEIAFLKREIDEIEDDCPDFIPASATFAAYLKGSTMADTTFPSGSTISLVGDVKNKDSVDIPNAVVWSADQGTLTVSPDPQIAQLVNVPDGQVTVTMTTTNGIEVQHTYTVADLTPASADFTASAV